jgi:uncharacterized protein (DUF2164 family)
MLLGKDWLKSLFETDIGSLDQRPFLVFVAGELGGGVFYPLERISIWDEDQ